MAEHRQRRHLDITVYGKVQGVYFRLTTKAVADQLGIKGIAFNKPDGTVYIEAEGDDFALESFLDWCREGPERAEVEKVDQVEGEMKNYRNFEVIRRSRG
ncbi:acylphosphatase [Parapedobacter defluvii]|uniref:acylphosphatase n=1 Tax=Parapedobacter defluvii TaxID=2045106 RepID=A0ABQ1LKS0_9SPHI|nr:acylphosphatase [Parapedobacter defluvii]RQP16531.1 MAG: acylphosphatase [Parapedobacter sp.]GGC25212.1 acylphosphatase [Parapedobacter defluvii]